MRSTKFFAIVFFLFVGTSGFGQVDTLSVLFRNSFEVFESLRNDKGVYRDSKVFEGADFHPSSVAATGMGLISLCIADAMGWIDDAESQVLTTLMTMSGKTPGFDPDRNINGFYRHWIDMETGARAWDSEYSTIDSGIFLASAAFARKYFCSNDDIGALMDDLAFDRYAAIADPSAGAIYLMMNADGSGVENALTLPFNEYMLLPWMSFLDDDFGHPGNELWDAHYANTDSLPKIDYQGIELLTDNPNNYLSSFVIQFPYYLIHGFSENPDYLRYMDNARRADSTWWANENIGASYQWGSGAGSADYGSGYHADKINDNPSHIHSPHIIAGYLPVSPRDSIYLKQQYKEGSNLYTLPNGQGSQVLWRKSLDNPTYEANEIQGVDYSTMLFGLASLDRFLGKEFFHEFNDFFSGPCNIGVVATNTSDPIADLFIAYPNPTTSDHFTIEMENAYRGSLTIQVYDLLGRKYYGVAVDKFDDVLEYDIDASSWVSGMYVIAITGDGVRGSARVLKE